VRTETVVLRHWHGGRPVTSSQEAHLSRVKAKFCSLVDAKYRAGVEEHGGELLEVPAIEILDFAIEEAIDQVVYLLSLKEKLTRGVA
jgi:hypothetical protein